MSNNFKINKNFNLVFVLYAAICLTFIFIVHSYTENEVQKESLKVQGHISSFLDIRSSSILKWVNDKDKAINSISENLTVKLFLQTLSDKKADKDDQLTQQQFTSSYLNSVANETGFKTANRPSKNVNAEFESTGSVIILDDKFKPVLSIDYSENLNEIIGSFPSIQIAKDVEFLKSGDGKKNFLKVVKKIHSMQSEKVLGYVVAIKKLDSDFFQMLSFPPSEYKTSKSQLVHKIGTKLEFISDDANANDVLEFENRDDLAEIYAVNNVNVIAEKRNSNLEQLYVSAKELGFNGIYLIHSVSSREAVQDAYDMAQSLRWISYLLSLTLGAILAFVWKHSVSEKYKNILSEVREKQRLLQIITENQIQSMFLIDDENKMVFGNKIFAKKNSIKNDNEFIDKPLENVVGISASDDFLKLGIKAHDTHEPVVNLRKTKQQGVDKYIQQKAIPINIKNADEKFKGSLFIENDISDLINERVKYEDNLNKTIDVLVKIIENRSKYFANHGKQVHQLSMIIAENLNVSDNYRKALDFASRISNLALAVLPRNIINKKEELTEEEKEMFNSVPTKTLEMVKDFTFDSPVVETLKQMNERIDGLGTLKLSGDQIIISAKILKVVSDFVSMTSPRPHRPSLTTEQAIEILLAEKDTKYSKEVVFALANVVGSS
jgi:HD-GYP domain-containing protein (c-di-GMP phosphodiesterase class II)